jgi:hypothetical protein
MKHNQRGLIICSLLAGFIWLVTAYAPGDRPAGVPSPQSVASDDGCAPDHPRASHNENPAAPPCDQPTLAPPRSVSDLAVEAVSEHGPRGQVLFITVETEETGRARN